eukprot:s3212_g11.t5
MVDESDTEDAGSCGEFIVTCTHAERMDIIPLDDVFISHQYRLKHAKCNEHEWDVKMTLHRKNGKKRISVEPPEQKHQRDQIPRYPSSSRLRLTSNLPTLLRQPEGNGGGSDSPSHARRVPDPRTEGRGVVADMATEEGKTLIQGGMSKSHPPPDGAVDKVRLGGKFFMDVSQKHWGKMPQENEPLLDHNIEDIKDLINRSKAEMSNLGYALRRHNHHNAGLTKNQIIIQDVLRDWMNLKYDLTLERAAAVTHLQAVVMATPLLHGWMRNFKITKLYNPLVFDVRNVLAYFARIIDLPGRLGVGGLPHPPC